MSLLFETIRVEQGIPRNLGYHKLRIEKSRKDVYGISGRVNIEDLLHVPAEFREGTSRCRVVYGKQIEEIVFSAYTPREIRSLKLVECNTIDYSNKYTDREQLNQLFQQRSGCDEILIVKNGLITDTSFSNIVFLHGNAWVTPAKPLLGGTMRAYLLHERIIAEKEIRSSNLKLFSVARLINAMLPFGSGPEIAIDNIRPL